MSPTLRSEALLADLEMFGVELGLGRVRRLLDACGDPQREVPTVLVAGTNGKGSTAALLAAMARAAGYRTGLYTSPHLEVVTERLAVDGRPIADRELARHLEALLELAAGVGATPTYFEALTVAAFRYFREQGVDLAVMEVGLGGRLDATNAGDPLLSVVTPVAVDHRCHLGDTPAQVAREKCGILRPGRPAVAWTEDPEVERVLRREAAERGADLRLAADRVRIEPAGEVPAGEVPGTAPQRATLHTDAGRYPVELHLAGRHQLANLALAVVAAETLAGHGFPRLDAGAVVAGAGRCRWPGRLEEVRLPDGRSVTLDAAHNPAGVRVLVEHLAGEPPSTRPPPDLLFGTMADKPVAEMLPPVAAACRRIVLTRPSVGGGAAAGTGGRSAADPKEWPALLPGRTVTVEPDPERALDRALDDCDRHLLVCGSIYLVGEVRRLLRRAFGVPPALGLVLTLLLFVLAGCGEPPRPPAVAGTVVHDLVLDFPVAETRRQTSRIDLGTPEARPHLVDGWSLDEEGRDGPFVWGVGDASVLDFYAVAAVDTPLLLRGRAFRYPDAPPQVVSLSVNGRPAGEVEVGRGLESHRLELPADALQPGVNRLEIRYSYSRSPAEVLPDAADERPLAVQWYAVELPGLRSNGEPRRAAAGADPEAGDDTAAPDRIELPAGTGVAYHYRFDPGQALAIRGLEAWGPGDGELLVTFDSAAGRMLHRLEPGDAETPLRFELPIDAPGLGRLAFSVEPPRSSWWRRLFGDAGSGVAVVGPAVLAPGDASPASDASPEPSEPTAAAGEPEPRRANVLIYMVDTLRADHLGLYGYPRPTSPRIDAFGAGATVFLDARAQTSWTRPAVASILTGLLPQAHRVNLRDQALAPEVETLAEILAADGYRTAGFTTNGNVSDTFGFAQGYESYRHLAESSSRTSVHQLADRLNARAFNWLERYLEEDTDGPGGERAPFFLYLHATDPHAPYTPPEPFRHRFAPGVDPTLGHIDHVRGVTNGQLPEPPGLRQAWIDLYDGEIAWTDHHFGRLLDRLEELGLHDSTAIVLISDHGEEFLDHGGWQHGRTLYEEQLRVPLVIRFPGGEGAGRRIAEVADQVDVLPTLLDHLGIPIPAGLDGRSLLPRLRDAAGDPAPKPSFAYLELGTQRTRSILENGWKLVLDRSEIRRHAPVELFHLPEDPGEKTDLQPIHPLRVGFLHQSLRRLDLLLEGRDGLATPEDAEMSDELRRQLEALGYIN